MYLISSFSCLVHLIELFALRFTCQRKRLGFLMNHALFLNKFKSLQKHNNKLNRIQTQVKELDHRTSSLRGTSRKGKSPQKLESENAEDDEQPVEREEENNGRGEAEKEVKKQTSFSPINEENDGLRSTMKCIKSSPTDRTTQGKPPNVHRNHFCTSKVLLRNNDSIVQERVPHSMLMYCYSYNEEELSIVGYQCKVAELWKKLENTDYRIIPLVGKLGSDKSMMARAVYGNKSIKEMCMPAAWASIFNESKTTDILIGLLMKKTELQDGSSEESLKSKLRQELTSQRYLIVLDYPDQQNGSKIIGGRKWFEQVETPQRIRHLFPFNQLQS